MSLNIHTVATVASNAVSRVASGPNRTEPAAPSTSDAPVKLDTLPLSPPPEVHAAMAVAADAYDKLAAKGLELNFQVDQRTGKVSVDVHDLHGNLLFTAPPSKALAIASGGSLD